MANLVRSRSWGQVKPPPGAQVDRGHPLAQGLVLSHAGNWRNPGYLNPAGPQFSSSAADNGTTPSGEGTRLASGTGFAFRGSNKYTHIQTGSYTIASIFTCISGNICMLVNDPAAGLTDSTGSWRYWQFTSSTSVVTFIPFGSSNTIAANFTASIVGGIPYMAVAVANWQTANAYIYLNGHQANTSTLTGSVQNQIDATQPMVVGESTGAGGVTYTALWDRALTRDEIAWLYNEPYAFITPTRAKAHAFLMPAFGNVVSTGGFLKP